MCRALLIFSFTFLALPVLHAQDMENAKQAIEILKKNCHECHGIRDYAGGLDVLDPVSLFADRGENIRPYLAKSDPAQSLIWRQIEAGLMPPDDNEFDIPAISPADKQTIKTWIEAGAPFPEGNRVFKRPFVGRIDILNIIEKDLRSLRGGVVAKMTRYFTVANLHNNGTVPDETLDYARASISKAMNSLSHESRIVVPRIVDHDANRVVLAVNLSDYGWTVDKWYKVLAQYPYTLVPEDTKEYEVYGAISRYWDEGEQEPCMRADWFVAHATRAPLYDELLHLPKTLDELARQHHVDMRGDFETQKLYRAGVFASGVSTQNRLLDRHSSANGCFWVSYDFAPAMAKGNISVFPLGPMSTYDVDKKNDNDDDKNPHPFIGSAFKEAGSEMVFSLPNGLHAYMIVDHNGNSISRAPVSIVSDHVTVDGVPEVVNGLSCMACHTKGIRDFTDKLRGSYYVDNAKERTHLENLFHQKGEMEAIMAKDRDVYLQSLLIAMKPFFPEKQLTLDTVGQLQEPCSMIARMYFKDIDIITAAAELGLESPDDLQGLGVRSLLKKGLAPFTSNGVIKRQSWHGQLIDHSVFQETAKELIIGQPVIQ